MQKEKPSLHLLALMLCASFILLDACQKKQEPDKIPDPPKEKEVSYVFTGKVTSTKGEPVAEAVVSVNGKEQRSDKEGNFKIESEKSGRYVVNIKKRGFGLVSKIFRNPMKDYNYKLQPAFVKVIDPTKTNVIRDEVSATTCTGNTSFQNLTFSEDYQKIPFVYDQNGNLIDFGWTPGMKPVFDQFAGPPVCNPGATVTIPANTIVDENGVPFNGPVTIAITTIDIFSEDGMPGDYTFEDENTTGAMVSMGAVSIELYSDDRSFNLDRKSKLKTKLAIPADPVKTRLSKKIPEVIPVLYYDDKKGVWRQENKQIARLNKKSKTYELEVEHFSAINLDFFQANKTCYKFRQDVAGGATLENEFVVYAMINAPAFTTHFGTELGTPCSQGAGGDNLHVLYNGPQTNTDLCLVLARRTATPTSFNAISIVKWPNEYTSTAGPNFVDPFTCAACDETQPTCLPRCMRVPFQHYTNEAILAGVKVGPGATAGTKEVKLKWIFKDIAGTAGTNYTYNIFAKDGPGTYGSAIQTGTLTVPLLGGNPITVLTLDIPDSGGQSNLKIEIDPDGPAALYSTNEITVD
jgi:hypothetical protein